MNYKLVLKHILEECCKPTFVVKVAAVEEFYGLTLENDIVEFKSIKRILGGMALKEFQSKLVEARFIVPTEYKPIARGILQGFQKNGDLSGHSHLHVVMQRFGDQNYPTEYVEFNLKISSELDSLKEFCTWLLKLVRSIKYIPPYSSNLEIPDRFDFKKLCIKFISPATYCQFENLLAGSLNDEKYIDWTGSKQELHFFIKSLKDVLKIPYNKHWTFAAMFFNIGGQFVDPDRLKELSIRSIRPDRARSLQAITNYLKTPA